MRCALRHFGAVAVVLAGCGGSETLVPVAGPSAHVVVAAAIATEAQQGLDLSGKTLDEAVRLLGEKKLEELQIKLDKLATERASIDAALSRLRAENDTLEAQRAKLEQEKADLQRQKDLFATGFFAALAATLVAVLGQLPKWLTLRLDVKLKALEVREREAALKAREAEIASKAAPKADEPGE